MSTVASLITRVQRQLLSGLVEDRNKLATQVTVSATSVSFQYDMSGIRSGTVIEVDSELMYVWEANIGTKTATVERGFNGTTAAAHATGTICTVGPRFPRSQILEAINDELLDLCSPVNGLYRLKMLDVRYNGTDMMINLPTIGEVISLVEVRYRNKSDEYLLAQNVQLIRNLPTKDFGSGMALKFNETPKQSDVRVVYRAPFSRAVRETDDLQVNCGYPASAEDILVMGAEIRLMAPREMKRNFTESQGDTRRSDEVPAGAISNSIANLIRLRRDRITAEATKLDSQYPVILKRV